MSRWITVTVTETRGSVPREVGASMRIRTDGQEGTIGGGALEWEAARIARDMLATNKTNDRRTLPLGPAMGQCCGGTLVLDFAADTEPEAPLGRPLWLWGAGHVGRALVATLAPLPDFDISWIDTQPSRFPDPLPDAVAPLVAADPPRVMPRAPKDAAHLILTYSHDIDLKLCDAALHHGFAFCGLIGSATKWARFRSRLAALGHSDAQIARITCPIGDPVLGKHPQAIAVGVAAQLLSIQALETAAGDR
jgi:xanthine dehydrogenase accessory factor